MASPGNRHCAHCIDTILFRISLNNSWRTVVPNSWFPVGVNRPKVCSFAAANQVVTNQRVV